jgi:hypothetical protein
MWIGCKNGHIVTNAAEPARDRPYVRRIDIRKEDRERFVSFLSTIPRECLVSRIKVETDTHYRYFVKLKKQELLYVELAFKVVVKKIKKRKKS